MNLFYSKFIKYFILLAVSFIAIKLIYGFIIFSFFPHLPSINNYDNSFYAFWKNIINLFKDFLINILFAILINKELKSLGIKSIPILAVTLFSALSGVIFYLILLFNTDFKRRTKPYENIY